MKEKDCILVVDDDEGSRKSLVLLLKRKGYGVEQAATGKEALAIAQGRSVNLTLLDIKLPDIEGVQLLAPLKITNPDMAIIMITGFASVESAVQSLTAGASGYVTKPINLGELLDKIKNALDHQHLVIEVRLAEEKVESLAKFPDEDPNPVFRVAHDSVLLFANKSAEFIQNEWRLSVGTKVPEFLEEIIKEAIESGSRRELEKTAGDTTYHLTVAPIIGQEYVNLYGLDITDQRKAERNLIENETKFRELFDNMSSGVAIYEANEDGNDFFFKNLNRAGERIDDLKREEVIGKSLLKIIPAIKEFGLFDVLQRVWRTGVPESHPASLYKDARMSGWRENFIYKLPSGEIAAIYNDITERIQAEEEMKRSFDRFKSIMDGLDALVYVVDMETYDLLFINKYGKDIWGDIEGQTCWETIPNGQTGPCPFCTNDRLVDRKGNPTGVYHWEFENTVSGAWFDCRDTAIQWLDGRLVRLEIATDITNRKRFEEKIAIVNRKLMLMNDVTYQDIQNKITALRGYSILRNDATTVAECKSLIGKEQLLLSTIHRIIDNTKDYQKIGLNQPEWIPVKRSIQQSAQDVSGISGLTIETDLHGLEIYADTLLDRIFYILIENTLKHGKTATHISFSTKEATNDLVLICEDDGIGIPLLKKTGFVTGSLPARGNSGCSMSGNIWHSSGFSLPRPVNRARGHGSRSRCRRGYTGS